MNKKLDKKDSFFYERHPYLPLITSISALIFSITTLIIKIIS
jgi:hypothetical protein